jgi:hypothetical protein
MAEMMHSRIFRQVSEREMDAKVEDSASEVTSKHEKFRDLAEKRTNRALDAIRRIGNLSNRQLYEFREDEVRKVTKALKDAVAEIEAKFTGPRRQSEHKFKL